MSFLKSTIKAILLSFVLSGCTLPFVTNKQAALQVSSSPKASVFIDGTHVGQTPFFDENLKSGDYSLKLVPEATADILPSWETIVKLTPQTLTVVNRLIGDSDTNSSGEILTLEPLSSKTKTILAIISIPDSSVVKLDSQPKGFTPVSLDDVSSGEHTITISAAGFQEKTLKAKITAGHKLTISAQLARQQLLPSPTPTPRTETSQITTPETVDQVASASSTTNKKPFVEVLANPLGFLRIRNSPSTSGVEIANAIPGQKLPYLDEEDNGWYKVLYQSGKSGWLARGSSGQYAKLVQ